MKLVYKYKAYDINVDAYKFSDTYATVEYIKRIDAVLLTETEKSVDESSLDSDGKEIIK